MGAEKPTLRVTRETSDGQSPETGDVARSTFLRDNIDDPEIVDAVADLQVGAIARFGGGAAPLVTVTRIA